MVVVVPRAYKTGVKRVVDKLDQKGFFEQFCWSWHERITRAGDLQMDECERKAKKVNL